MAHLLSPICTEALKIHNPLLNLSSPSSWRLPAGTSSHCKFGNDSAKRRCFGRVKVAAKDSASSTLADFIADDNYVVLGLMRFVMIKWRCNGARDGFMEHFCQQTVHLRLFKKPSFCFGG